MAQPYVKISCDLDGNRQKLFFFYLSDGLPLPNYCEDYRPCPECKACALKALDKLIAEAKPLFIDPLDSRD